MSSSDRADVYTRVTQEILNAIEAGPSKFKMPWHHDGAAVTRPVNIASKKPYRGINTVALWASTNELGSAARWTRPVGVGGSFCLRA